jgi:AraC-like DNA-binding protein
MIFHIHHRGEGYVLCEGEAAPRRLGNGDVLLFPHGHAHCICDHPASPLTLAVELTYDAHRDHHRVPCADGRPSMVLLCGAFHVEHPRAFPLLHCLPTLIHIPGERGRLAPGLADIVGLITRESAAPQPGTEAVLRRLTELLFIHVIRVWIDQFAGGTGGWIAALRDKPLSMALGLMHQAPDRAWTVTELAAAVGLSRSAFSMRFTTLVGEPPMRYLTRWRMLQATRLLKHNITMEQIAQHLGYESDVAFRKAFKRELGLPPARYRRLG